MLNRVQHIDKHLILWYNKISECTFVKVQHNLEGAIIMKLPIILIIVGIILLLFTWVAGVGLVGLIPLAIGIIMLIKRKKE